MPDPKYETLGSARAIYFEANSMPPDGGIDERWVRGKIGPIPFAFPNSDSRRALVPYHDLHHVLTEYSTDLAGEAQVGAWEIGSGMRDVTGLLLDLSVWGFMLPAQPRAVFRAFSRGRRSRNLLDYAVDDALLARSVVEMQRELKLDETLPGSANDDRAAFACWSALAVGVAWGPLIPLAALVWWLV